MSPQSDPTFRKYDCQQAQKYAESRLSYPVQLYSTIIDFHTQSSGGKHFIADVGCGPGNATRDLAIHFDHAIGLDPSVEMIKIAGQLGGRTKSEIPLKFVVSTAEDLFDNSTSALPAIKENGGVDLLTAAMAVSSQSLSQYSTSRPPVDFFGFIGPLV
jgi:SAM-dependent methyltransferase